MVLMSIFSTNYDSLPTPLQFQFSSTYFSRLIGYSQSLSLKYLETIKLVEVSQNLSSLTLDKKSILAEINPQVRWKIDSTISDDRLPLKAIQITTVQ